MWNVTVLLASLSCAACLGAGMDDDASALVPDNATSTGSDADVTIAGAYQLQTQLQLTAGALIPGPGYQFLQDLEKDPGAAIVTLAEAGGVPAAEQLYDALPSSLRGRLSDWISDAVTSSGELQVLMAWSQLVLAEVELRSSLQIGSWDLEGRADGRHDLDSLVFDFQGQQIEQAIPSVEAIPGAGHASVDVWRQDEQDGPHLIFGEQRFGLRFGELAFQAFQGAIGERYGTDLRGLLGRAISCEQVADTVANQCVLNVCVAHESLLAQLCNGALDKAEASIHAEFTAFDTELLRLSSGEALVVGGDVGSRLSAGEWAAAADFGLGLRPLPAQFVGESR